MALAALAILGQRSAHSFPIGPVIADPKKQIIIQSNHIKPKLHNYHNPQNPKTEAPILILNNNW